METERNQNLKEEYQSFEKHYTIVAVEDNIIAGFGDIDKNGYLDHLYVHKNYQRKGIAAAICDKLEQTVDTDRIYTHASITEKPFFEQRGYNIIKEQQVVRNGITLTNYLMEKNNDYFNYRRFSYRQDCIGSKAT